MKAYAIAMHMLAILLQPLNYGPARIRHSACV